MSFEGVHDNLNNFLDIGFLLNLTYELRCNFSFSFNFNLFCCTTSVFAERTIVVDYSIKSYEKYDLNFIFFIFKQSLQR